MVCIFWGHHTHSVMEANISYVCFIEVNIKNMAKI